jgi:2-oxoglutarate dehydrogenase E2 component (dihydrolipoamide succinyltransferase)
MSVEIKVPTVGESINEVTLTKWIKKDGDYVERDEVIAELESEKATFEINAEKAGILHTAAKEEDNLQIGDVVGTIDDTAEKPAGKEAPAKEKQEAPKAESKKETKSEAPDVKVISPEENKPREKENIKATPVAAAILAEKKIDVSKVTPTGTHGRITKHDVMDALENPGRAVGKELFSREEKTQKMSNLRRTISRRLVEAKNSTAMLTTYNEVEMAQIM